MHSFRKISFQVLLPRNYFIAIRIWVFWISNTIILYYSDQPKWILRATVWSNSHNRINTKKIPVIMTFIFLGFKNYVFTSQIWHWYLSHTQSIIIKKFTWSIIILIFLTKRQSSSPSEHRLTRPKYNNA